MLHIRTVLCPVGFDDLDAREIELAAEVCRAFGARLILHHNLGGAPPGAAMSWMWRQEHPDGGASEEAAAARLAGILAGLPGELAAEARLSSGMAGPAILSAEEQAEADLVVMATRGADTEDHASVTAQTIEHSRCPVLVLRSGCAAPGLRLEPAPGAGLRRVVVPTDLAPSGKAAVSYACELARALPWELHLLHVIPAGRSVWSDAGAPLAVPERRGGPAFERATAELDALVPADLESRVRLHVVLGDPAEEIAKLSARLGASCIVMGAHARGFLRRFFTRDTSRELLHRAPCPVWFVPESRAGSFAGA